MKKLICTLALAVCAASLPAQTPHYLPSNGCTNPGGNLKCPTVTADTILTPTNPAQSLANLGAAGGGNLVTWNNALINMRRNGSASQVSVAWIGDSYAVDENITTPFRTALQTQFGMAGYGWVDLYYLSNVQPGITIGAAGTWVTQRQTPSSTGLNISDVRTSDTVTPARLTVTVQQNTATATLFYLKQPGGGTFQWWVDAATPIVISTAAGSTSIGTSTITGLDNTAAHTFQVQITAAGSVGICISGMDLRSSSNGVVVHNLGSAGSDTNHWVATNAALWQSQLAAVNPSLVTIMLSPNDQADSITVNQQATNLTTLIGRIRAAVPGASIALMPPPDNGLGRSPAMSAYNGSQKTLAASLGVGYIDVLDAVASAALVDTGSGAFNGLWFKVDLLHPNQLGGQVISNTIFQGLAIPTPVPVTYDAAGNLIVAPPAAFVGDSHSGYGSLRVMPQTSTMGSSIVIMEKTPSVLPWKIDINDSCGTFNLGFTLATAQATNVAPPTWAVVPTFCMKSDGNYIPAIKATTGVRYVCVDTNGKLVSQAAACSGT